MICLKFIWWIYLKSGDSREIKQNIIYSHYVVNCKYSYVKFYVLCNKIICVH